MLTNKRLLFIVIVLVSVFSAKAQNTNSAYSRYGYGVLNDKAVGASKGMGGISYGIRGQNVNPGNPASYSNMDSLTFLFDIGISFTQSRFKAPEATQNDDNGGLDYLALQFPLSNKLAFSAGFLPYSSVGYSFGNISEKDNIITQSTFQGLGGLGQIYGGLSYRISKNLSMGANVAYLSGRTEHQSSVMFLNGNIPSSGKYRKLTVNAVKIDIGVQYQVPVKIQGHLNTLTVGAVYIPSIKPSTRMSEITVANNSADTTAFGVDTQLPHTLGIGFTLFNNRNFTYGLDVTYQKWSGVDYPNAMGDQLSVSDRFNDRWRINAGLEYVAAPMEPGFFKRVKLRGGLNYSNSYLNVKESNTGKIGGYKEYGATIGFGLPFRTSIYVPRTSYVNINFEYTRLNPDVKTMIEEDYFGVSIGLSMNDLWFMKNKFR